MSRVGQNRIYTPYMAVYLVIFLPKIPYIHRICMALANPTYVLELNLPIPERTPALVFFPATVPSQTQEHTNTHTPASV